MKKWQLLLPILLGTSPVFADEHDDHDRARAAVLRGEILSLERIMTIAQEEIVGRIIDVELEDEDGVYIYELEILAEDGRIIELNINAASGLVLTREIDD